MTAVRKITEAENILVKLRGLHDKEFQLEFSNFIKTIHEVFTHLLDEYNNKFDLKIERIGLEKFKSKAKKLGRIDVINFLIWYEKEYRILKNDDVCGYLLEKQDEQSMNVSNINNIVNACSILLDKIRTMTYYAYENF